ncbi:MAG: hypothetical protein ACD_60C00072G0010 [uncultured bacterium]|nr:MAG: hypothetical protein ACD_60C00072G0010 [uncultured bacterium]
MSHTMIDTAVEILGKTYLVKCSVAEVDALQRAAEYLERKIRTLQESNTVINVDKILIITALNVTHQLLEKENHVQDVNQRLQALQNKIERALMPGIQLELQSAK